VTHSLTDALLGCLPIVSSGPRKRRRLITRALTAAGIAVVEVEWPTRSARHRAGKSDRIDAYHAAQSVLGVAVEVDHYRSVQQPVEHGGGDGGVAEDLAHDPTGRFVVMMIEVFR
jgi:hypothetical protein